MKHWLQKTMLLGLVVAFPIMDATAQFFPKNDTTVAFSSTTNTFGRIRTYDGSNGKYTSNSDRMFDVLMPNVAQNNTTVWNIYSPPDEGYIKRSVAYNADSSSYVQYTLLDDSYNQAATINVGITVWMWENTNYALARFSAINIASSARNFTQSTVLRANIHNAINAQSLEHVEGTKRTYIFNNDGAVGVQALSKNPVSARLLDNADYDNTDPTKDNARESYRYGYMTHNAFDAKITSGADGGWAYVNFGTTNDVAAGDSVYYWIAYTHGDDLDQVDERLTAAAAKFAELTTSVEENLSDVIPSRIDLNQNYPNPFNPSTSISFTLPNAQYVSLNVYNALGQEVATLANGIKAAGMHTLSFNAANLPSGVYIYKLEANGQSIVRKMSLIK